MNTLWTSATLHEVSILEWDSPPPLSRRVHLAVDTSDSCWANPHPANALIRDIAHTLVSGDQCFVWLIGDTSPVLSLEVTHTTNQNDVYTRIKRGLEPGPDQPNTWFRNKGTWLMPTLTAMASHCGQNQSLGGKPFLLVATDGEIFDVGELYQVTEYLERCLPGQPIGLMLLNPSAADNGLLGRLRDTLGRQCDNLGSDSNCIGRFLALPTRETLLSIPSWSGCVYCLNSEGKPDAKSIWEFTQGNQRINLPGSNVRSSVALVGDGQPQPLVNGVVAKETHYPPRHIQKQFDELGIFSKAWWHYPSVQKLMTIVDGSKADGTLACRLCQNQEYGLNDLRLSLYCNECNRFLLAENPAIQDDYPIFWRENAYWQFFLGVAGTLNQTPPRWNMGNQTFACEIGEIDSNQRVLRVMLKHRPFSGAKKSNAYV